MASKIARRFETALLPLGILALGILIWKIGPEERAQLVALMTDVRWWFLVIIVQAVAANAANTAGLLACLPLDRASL
ncbi:MAG TPA: hypothetical protein VFF73_14755, partial [Planctomycetota bacterium]|nr:hypothetical protein [Planctomycetota bacterium]